MPDGRRRGASGLSLYLAVLSAGWRRRNCPVPGQCLFAGARIFRTRCDALPAARRSESYAQIKRGLPFCCRHGHRRFRVYTDCQFCDAGFCHGIHGAYAQEIVRFARGPDRTPSLISALLPQIDHSFRLTERTLEGAWLDGSNARSHSDQRFYMMSEIAVAHCKYSVVGIRSCLYHNGDLIESIDPAHLDYKVGCQPFIFENDLLDLAGEHIDAAHNHHVVGTSSDLLHP